MGTLGLRRQPEQSGYSTSIIAGSNPEWLFVGATIDWSAVAALGSDTTYPNGQLVKAGKKVLRYGQVMARRVSDRKFIPYDPAAVTANTQSIARGDVGIVNETVVQDGAFGLGIYDDEHLGLVTGGPVWLGKLIQAGTGTASVAAGPQLATLLAALPTLIPVTK